MYEIKVVAATLVVSRGQWHEIIDLQAIVELTS
jgi:hypothetical protein